MELLSARSKMVQADAAMRAEQFVQARHLAEQAVAASAGQRNRRVEVVISGTS